MYFAPMRPVIAARFVYHDDGKYLAFAGLHQRQHLETFVLRAEAAGKQGDGVGLLHEQQLAREEVFQVHQLEVAADDGVGFLLERQQDVDADALLAAGADLAGLHDAAGRAR